MRVLLSVSVAAVLSGACGGGFRIGNDRYSTTAVDAVAVDSDDVAGVRVKLQNSGTQQVDDDRIALFVTLYWPKNSPPPYERELKLDNAGDYRASIDVDCRCSGLVKPLSQPSVTGRFRLDRYSNQQLGGWFDVKFTGDIPLTSGGMGFENTQVTANTAFVAPRIENLTPR